MVDVQLRRVVLADDGAQDLIRVAHPHRAVQLDACAVFILDRAAVHLDLGVLVRLDRAVAVRRLDAAVLQIQLRRIRQLDDVALAVEHAGLVRLGGRRVQGHVRVAAEVQRRAVGVGKDAAAAEHSLAVRNVDQRRVGGVADVLDLAVVKGNARFARGGQRDDRERADGAGRLVRLHLGVGEAGRRGVGGDDRLRLADELELPLRIAAPDVLAREGERRGIAQAQRRLAGDRADHGGVVRVFDGRVAAELHAEGRAVGVDRALQLDLRAAAEIQSRRAGLARRDVERRACGGVGAVLHRHCRVGRGNAVCLIGVLNRHRAEDIQRALRVRRAGHGDGAVDAAALELGVDGGGVRAQRQIIVRARAGHAQLAVVGSVILPRRFVGRLHGEAAGHDVVRAGQVGEFALNRHFIRVAAVDVEIRGDRAAEALAEDILDAALGAVRHLDLAAEVHGRAGDRRAVVAGDDPDGVVVRVGAAVEQLDRAVDAHGRAAARGERVLGARDRLRLRRGQGHGAVAVRLDARRAAHVDVQRIDGVVVQRDLRAVVVHIQGRAVRGAGGDLAGAVRVRHRAAVEHLNAGGDAREFVLAREAERAEHLRRLFAGDGAVVQLRFRRRAEGHAAVGRAARAAGDRRVGQAERRLVRSVDADHVAGDGIALQLDAAAADVQRRLIAQRRGAGGDAAVAVRAAHCAAGALDAVGRAAEDVLIVQGQRAGVDVDRRCRRARNVRVGQGHVAAAVDHRAVDLAADRVVRQLDLGVADLQTVAHILARALALAAGEQAQGPRRLGALQRDVRPGARAHRLEAGELAVDIVGEQGDVRAAVARDLHRDVVVVVGNVVRADGDRLRAVHGQRDRILAVMRVVDLNGAEPGRGIHEVRADDLRVVRQRDVRAARRVGQDQLVLQALVVKADHAADDDRLVRAADAVVDRGVDGQAAELAGVRGIVAGVDLAGHALVDARNAQPGLACGGGIHVDLVLRARAEEVRVERALRQRNDAVVEDAVRARLGGADRDAVGEAQLRVGQVQVGDDAERGDQPELQVLHVDRAEHAGEDLVFDLLLPAARNGADHGQLTGVVVADDIGVQPDVVHGQLLGDGDLAGLAAADRLEDAAHVHRFLAAGGEAAGDAADVRALDMIGHFAVGRHRQAALAHDLRGLRRAVELCRRAAGRGARDVQLVDAAAGVGVAVDGQGAAARVDHAGAEAVDDHARPVLGGGDLDGSADQLDRRGVERAEDAAGRDVALDAQLRAGVLLGDDRLVALVAAALDNDGLVVAALGLELEIAVGGCERAANRHETVGFPAVVARRLSADVLAVRRIEVDEIELRVAAADDLAVHPAGVARAGIGGVDDVVRLILDPAAVDDAQQRSALHARLADDGVADDQVAALAHRQVAVVAAVDLIDDADVHVAPRRDKHVAEQQDVQLAVVRVGQGVILLGVRSAGGELGVVEIADLRRRLLPALGRAEVKGVVRDLPHRLAHGVVQHHAIRQQDGRAARVGVPVLRRVRVVRRQKVVDVQRDARRSLDEAGGRGALDPQKRVAADVEVGFFYVDRIPSGRLLDQIHPVRAARRFRHVQIVRVVDQRVCMVIRAAVVQRFQFARRQRAQFALHILAAVADRPRGRRRLICREDRERAHAKRQYHGDDDGQEPAKSCPLFHQHLSFCPRAVFGGNTSRYRDKRYSPKLRV